MESGGRGVVDVTEHVRRVVEDSGVREGAALVYAASPGTAVITVEYEPRLLRDLERLIERLLDRGGRAALAVFPPSVIVPVVKGGVELGPFQQVCLLDLSGQAGTKKVYVMVGWGP